tara:strand:+ start:258 stop:458 length:201 start_codon:yes stop_codon:yes gene_type:complete
MKVMSVKEVAGILEVTPSQVRSLCREGRIESRHNPKSFHIEIKDSSLNRYIKKGKKRLGTRRKCDA